MATTKIWAIKDDISRVLKYASNPNKTNIPTIITTFTLFFITIILDQLMDVK